MHLELSDQETAALLGELDRIIDGDHYPFSPRIRILKGIRAKIQPYPERPPSSPTKYYPPPSKGPIPATLLKTCPDCPMPLGGAAAAHLRLIVRCRDCRHDAEPVPVEMGERYSVETPVLQWRERLMCSRCGGRNMDVVLTRTRR